MLPGALSAGNLILPKLIDSLADEYRMPVCGIQGIADIRLISKPVPAVFGFPVNDISCNTIAVRRLCDQRQIVSSCAVPGGHGRRHGQRSGIPGIDPMILKQYQGLVVAAHTIGGGYCLRLFYRSIEPEALSVVIENQRRMPFHL